MLYGVNKLLSTYQFFSAFYFRFVERNLHIYNFFSNTDTENVFTVLIAYHYYSFEANDFSNV